MVIKYKAIDGQNITNMKSHIRIRPHVLNAAIWTQFESKLKLKEKKNKKKIIYLKIKTKKSNSSVIEKRDIHIKLWNE